MGESASDQTAPIPDDVAANSATGDARTFPDLPDAADRVSLPDQLAHVIDDTDGREEAVKWAENQLLAGATFEVIAAELVSQGWQPVSADSIIEEAREATRAQRGVRTRDDVVIGIYRKFGKTMRRVRWFIVLGIVAVIIIVSMILNQQ